MQPHSVPPLFEADNLPDDQLREECGVFGIFNHPNAAELTYYGIHALQHRGQESAGICVSDGKEIAAQRGMGLVTEALSKQALETLRGPHAIGHVRYTTAGGSVITNAQPLRFRYTGGQVALGHNGNLVNARQLRDDLERKGSIFQTDSDTEVISHLMAQSGLAIEKAVQTALLAIEGAFALVMLTPDKLIAAQDPRGFRPLCLGKIGNDSWVVASETCALNVVDAEFVREFTPGELLIIDQNGPRSMRFAAESPRTLCSFEYIYFARPDSDLSGISVHLARKKLGAKLFEESPAEADIVVGVPDSGLSTAIGYAEAAGLPYEVGMIKNRYVGRTFIQPNQMLRKQGVKMKLSVVRQVIAGKRIVLIDDSIVRGNTSGRIVKMLREAGAKEIHMRISAPPIRYSCLYGIDTPTRSELIAAQHSVEEICESIHADSLRFISTQGMIEAIGREDSAPNRGHCLACFDGSYPTPTYEESYV
jgi:amidophosphoribosyltransferase